jgi:hypothetical protein
MCGPRGALAAIVFRRRLRKMAYEPHTIVRLPSLACALRKNVCWLSACDENRAGLRGPRELIRGARPLQGCKTSIFAPQSGPEPLLPQLGREFMPPLPRGSGRPQS